MYKLKGQVIQSELNIVGAVQRKDDSFIFHVRRIHIKCVLNGYMLYVNVEKKQRKKEISIRFFILHHHSNRERIRPSAKGINVMRCMRTSIVLNHWSTSRYFFSFFIINEFSVFEVYTCAFEWNNNEMSKMVNNFDN